MSKWLMMLLLVLFGAGMVGCEAEGRIDADDDDARLEVDVDD